MDHQDLQDLLREATSKTSESSTDPFLTDRIMHQVTSLDDMQHQFFHMLWHAFRHVAFVCVLMTIGFISYNLLLSRNYEVTLTPVELVFGLEPMTVTTTYLSDFETLPATIP